jgi:exosome complex RNA-binding protein Rrp42 (RNase PH superfamily)
MSALPKILESKLYPREYLGELVKSGHRLDNRKLDVARHASISPGFQHFLASSDLSKVTSTLVPDHPS